MFVGILPAMIKTTPEDENETANGRGKYNRKNTDVSVENENKIKFNILNCGDKFAPR
jgi:hypothetical protein